MKAESKAMKVALRTVRLFQIAMLVSVVLYVVVGELVRPVTSAHPTLLYFASVASISIIGAMLVVRRTLVLQSEEQLRQKPGDALVLSRWKTGYIVTFLLCELVALFGLSLRLVGFSRSHVWPYYAGGFALLLLFWPTRPRGVAK